MALYLVRDERPRSTRPANDVLARVERCLVEAGNELPPGDEWSPTFLAIADDLREAMRLRGVAI